MKFGLTNNSIHMIEYKIFTVLLIVNGMWLENFQTVWTVSVILTMIF